MKLESYQSSNFTDDCFITDIEVDISDPKINDEVFITITTQQPFTDFRVLTDGVGIELNHYTTDKTCKSRFLGFIEKQNFTIEAYGKNGVALVYDSMEV